MICGTDDADCQQKLEDAKARGVVVPGDRYDARTCPDPEWPSRWTTLDQISRELNIIAGPVEFCRSNPLMLQFSDVELCEIYAEGLPRV